MSIRGEKIICKLLPIYFLESEGFLELFQKPSHIKIFESLWRNIILTALVFLVSSRINRKGLLYENRLDWQIPEDLLGCV